jgi:hypothetical protein
VELDAQFAEDVDVSLYGLIGKLSEMKLSSEEVMAISRWVKALFESLAKSIPCRNVWCLCLDRVASIHDPRISLQLSVPPCLHNSLEL